MPTRKSSSKSRGQRSSENRFFERVLLVIGSVTILLHCLAFGPLRDSFWGVHHFAFLPPLFLVLGLALLSLPFLIGRASQARDSRLRLPAGGRSRLPGPVGWTVLFAVSSTLFWSARVRHIFLGDGLPLVISLPQGEAFHPRQPLTMALQQLVYRASGGLFTGTPEAIAQQTVALGSVLCGGLFVLVAWGLAGEILAHVRLRAAKAEPAARPGGERYLLAGAIVLQGYVVLYLGYVENYTFYALALAGYLLASLRYLRGRAPLVLALAASVLCLALHLSAGILLPSVTVLVAVGLRDGERRRRTLRDLALGVTIFAAAALLLNELGGGYSLVETFLETSRLALSGEEERAASYMFSAVHLRDFLNEQLLIGPLGLFLFVPAAAYVCLRPKNIDGGTLFLLAAGLTYAGASWFAGDSNLGYARNWDLLAPGGIVFTVAGLYLSLRGRSRSRRLTRGLTAALALSMFHTLPWVAVNASEPGSLERVKHLPLGLGRAQVMVATWYGNRGETNEAKIWIRRALEENPYNNNAYSHLGHILVDEGDFGRAADAFKLASRLRPDKNEYRAACIDALLRAGRLQEALPELEALIERSPYDASAYAMLGQVYFKLGRLAEAKSALEQATRLAPEVNAYRIFLGRIVVEMGK